MMMSFCRKMSPHSFLGLTPTTPTSATTTSIDENLPFSKCHPINSCLTGSAGGGLLGLVTATNGGIHRQPGHVLESSSVKLISSSSSSSSSSLSSSSSSWPSLSSSSPPSSPPPEAASSKKDPGGIGFIDDIGGGVDGLMSCTESLGFESSDERRVDDQIEGSIKNIDGDHDEDEDVYRQLASNRSKLWRRRSVEQLKNTKNEKKFPPPISSLNQNGQPSFYLRPVRKDGRLELTEVRIYRPEILRAYRQDGRLRLHLVRHDDEDQQDQLLEDCIEEEEEEIVQEAVDEQVNFVEEDKNSVVKEETSVDGGEWKLPVGGGKGYRRCQKAASRHHHHHHGHHHGNMGVWRQQLHCVTTR